ncbi:hypothetical protein C468_16934 [Halorubrum kocurii JCM 14978]|uniref:Uncharacterized protein n=1 Tax=Halorubrum kocurii JCM 14978 TaxID=1230456 RepID=M0NHI1_9EURY|nr:hypothetical protein C468_16934 [Halorubrum kocurii JCM 14978]
MGARPPRLRRRRQVERGDDLDCLDAAFYEHAAAAADSTTSEELVDGQESSIAAILREGVEQHRSTVRDDDIPMTGDDLGASVDLAKAIEDTTVDDVQEVADE